MYDPRREARRQLARVPLPDDIDPRDLDSETRRQLQSLSKDTAELVARHLIMAGRLMDDEPQQALAHARAARALAGRIGPAREANGLVAYVAGEWAEALSELRAARRMTGQPDHLAVMADCERALGRPDRALMVTEDPQAKGLEPAARVELMIVASGARRDLGQADAAVALLQVPALEGPVRAWTARLRYAYADALVDAGRHEEARQWFARAAEVDERNETDAEDRLLELDGLVFEDLLEGDGDEETLLGETLLEQDGDEAGQERGRSDGPPVHLTTQVAEVSVVTSADSDGPADVEPVGDASTEQGGQANERRVDVPATFVSPEDVNRPTNVVQDGEIPALVRAGSTAIGFLEAPGTDAAVGAAVGRVAGGPEPDPDVAEPEVEGAPGGADEPATSASDDDLRLFD